MPEAPQSAPERPFSSIEEYTQDGVLVVTINNPPVNAISADVRRGLRAAVHRANADENIRAIIITGAGRNFVGGADIREFGKQPVEPALPHVLHEIEQTDKPVIAAINGAALGGGCEIALACHYRIALSGVRLGLPEVKLGIIPGAGGTQRLPRLIGAAAAMDLIGGGRLISAGEAFKLGLVDRITDQNLIEAALSNVEALRQGKLRRTSELAVPDIRAGDVDNVAAKITARARGQAAPGEAARLVRLAGTRSFQEGVDDERATFLRLRDSDEAKALRHLFFAERAAAKVEGIQGVEPQSVRMIGVVGIGFMGSGIAASALGAGYNVIGVEHTAEAAEAGRERIAGLLDRSLKSGRISEQERSEQINRLTVTAETEELAVADMVIEAVFDDLQTKAALFNRLDSIVRPDAILATNTSYLDPDDIAAATQYPERVVGLHFFSPAHVMRLVEVVRCAKTAPATLVTALHIVRRLNKLPIVTGVCEGFIGNRIFSSYRREAEFLIEDGALPHEIDRALENYGFPMGLFAVNDLAGLEIAWSRRKRQAETRDPGERYVDIADRLCEAGRFGQKAGRGWYAYSDGKRVVDPEVTGLIEASRRAKGIVPRAFSDDEIMFRLLAAMAAEGKALLDEGIAARSSDIDLVMINGYGFPAHKGGPMYVAGWKEQ